MLRLKRYNFTQYQLAEPIETTMEEAMKRYNKVHSKISSQLKDNQKNPQNHLELKTPAT
jgi:hypothetical protein